MKLVALAFSDLHLHRWKAFSKDDSRMKAALDIIWRLRMMAQEREVPLLFTGDLIHNEKAIDNKVLSYLSVMLSPQLTNTIIWAISGNHDMSEKNTVDHGSPSYISSLENLAPHAIQCLDFKVKEFSDIRVFGIPYLTGNKGLIKTLKGYIPQAKDDRYNILMLHTDLPGATDAFGHVIDEVENMRTKYFKHFDLVIDGHIHKPQKFSKNTYILGAPYQQTRSEKGLDLGYWEIYSDAKPKKIKLGLPKFIDIEEGQPIPEDGHFYTVIPKPRELFQGAKFDAKLDRVKLAKKYLEHTEVKEKHFKKALIKVLNSTQ